MTIHNLTSQELNRVFTEARDSSKDLETQIVSMKKDITKKMSIIQYNEEFINKKLDAINAGIFADNKVSTFSHLNAGMYTDYGYMVHPKFKKAPIDIFNLPLLSGDNMFKQSIIATMNGVESESYANILMKDNTLNKEIVFEELKTDKVTLSYTLDNTIALGTSRFNVIEIDPYMQGAYDLMSIEIYSLEPNGLISEEPHKVVNGFENIGRTRIVLDQKYKFTKVVLNFKNNFKSISNGIDIYPFGLKHIYFMEADFLDESFIIAEIFSDQLIEYIYDDIKLYTINGVVEARMNEYKMEVYSEYDYNTLTGRIYASDESQIHRIPKNTKHLYIKIPLIRDFKTEINDKKEYLGLHGVKFNYVTTEEIVL